MISAFFLSCCFLFLVFTLSWFLGGYILRVMNGEKKSRVCVALETLFSKIVPRAASIEMTYKEYIAALLSFELVALLLLYILLRLQPFIVSYLFSETAPSLSPHIALNIAISFITNTNWQCISPEDSLHAFSKVVLLIPNMFLAPAVGLACFFALLRGMASETRLAGNFFRDLIRTLVSIIIPFVFFGSVLLMVLHVEQGYSLKESAGGAQPLAFFESIKLLGTNGGGYWEANSAGLRENPTSWTTLVEWAMMLILPMATFRVLSDTLGCRKYGIRVGILFCCAIALLTAFMDYSESGFSSPVFLDQSSSALHGKEVRVGSFVSSLWSTSTTATSCGATVCNMCAMGPYSKIVLLSLMHTGETVFGGVGVGALSLIFMQVVAMFSAGLLVGRTPEVFGKKIDSGTMKLSLLAVMLPVFLIYIGLWMQISFGRHELPVMSDHGMTPLIYSMTSTAVNNGSGLFGLSYTPTIMTTLHSFLMLVGRLVVLLLALLLGDHFGKMKIHPRSEGSIHIESWTSVIWLLFVTISSSVLCFCSLWIIGPFLEG